MTTADESQMCRNEKFVQWRTAMEAMSGPFYLRMLAVLEAEIQGGRMAEGEVLPSQRELAKALGVHFTTVTRVYEQAKRLGLIESRHGQGTFVARAGRSAERGTVLSAADGSLGTIDLSSITPASGDADLALTNAVQQMTGKNGFAFSTRRTGASQALDQEAGRAWLSPRFDASLEGRVALAAGTRNALIALLAILVGSGGSLLVEAMCWPTVRTLASVLGITLHPVALDGEGILPEALDAAAQATQAMTLYCVPTLQNPTGAVMGLGRRRALVKVARQRGLTVIEDDAYGGLQTSPPPLLGALAPDITYSIFGLAKLISPTLRLAYVVCPNAAKTEQLADLLRATMQSAPPLEAALATHLVHDGLLATLVERIRKQTKARQALARQLLAGHRAAIADHALFLWLMLPEPWEASDFSLRLRRENVLVAPGHVFAVESAAAPNAVRIATGAATTTEALSEALQRIRNLLAQNPSLRSAID